MRVSAGPPGELRSPCVLAFNGRPNRNGGGGFDRERIPFKT